MKKWHKVQNETSKISYKLSNISNKEIFYRIFTMQKDLQIEVQEQLQVHRLLKIP